METPLFVHVNGSIRVHDDVPTSNGWIRVPETMRKDQIPTHEQAKEMARDLFRARLIALAKQEGFATGLAGDNPVNYALMVNVRVRAVYAGHKNGQVQVGYTSNPSNVWFPTTWPAALVEQTSPLELMTEMGALYAHLQDLLLA